MDPRFDTELTLTGPVRAPAQMLGEQTYDGHTSVHDDATAASLGLRGAPIEGPTHFSQFDPLAFALWGDRWFEEGCLSAHFQTMVVEGEQVTASLTTVDASTARIVASKTTGETVLTGTASVGPEHRDTEAGMRLARSGTDAPLHIIDQLAIGMRSDAGVQVMTADQSNGHLYPFSLAQKLARITEPHPWYHGPSPWGGAIVPFEMVSVLAFKRSPGFPVRTPSVGLFLDLEVRMHAGPVMVGEPYRVEHELVGLGQSRRTESYWTRATVRSVSTDHVVATVLLHQGVFKDSFPGYPPAGPA